MNFKDLLSEFSKVTQLLRPCVPDSGMAFQLSLQGREGHAFFLLCNFFKRLSLSKNTSNYFKLKSKYLLDSRMHLIEGHHCGRGTRV